MMKKTILLILLACVYTFAGAQEEKPARPAGGNDDIETIFSKPSKIRGYIGPLTNITTIDGETAYMSGINAAGIFNDHLIVGFYRVDLENNIFSNNNNYAGSTLNFDHKGLWLGYIFMPKRIIHFNTNVQLGKGNLEIYDDILDSWIDDDLVFVVAPSIEAEFNIAKFLRVGIGANYRFAFDVDKFDNYSDSDFSDFGAFVSLKFGWFR